MGLKIQAALLLLLSISHHILAQSGKTKADSTATSTSTTTTTTPGEGGTTPPAGGGGGGVGGAYNYPPPPAEGHGGFPGGFPGGFGGGFPFFPGFFKNFDVSAGAGFGPYGFGGGFPGGFGGGLPGGLGGLLGGGIPPPIDGDIPPPDGGFGGPLGGFGGPGFGGFGGFGPSYLPSTWIGSALGAKGDLLFPIVIFVFFVVGVWTVIQLLLGFIVPLIASKFTLKGAALGKPGGFLKRAVTSAIGDESLASPVVSPDLDFITNSVMEAINEPKCMKYVACHSGKFLNSMAGGGDQTNSTYEGILKTLSSMARSEALDIFERAFVNGACDCSKYTCKKVEDGHAKLVQNDLNNSTKTNSSSDPTKTNEVN